MFDEGAGEILDNGLPATVYFLLSTRGVDAGTAHAAGNTLSGGVGEITGTGYARQSQACPAAGLDRDIDFVQMSWTTGSATDWPALVRSVVLVTTADNTGKAICAWNLVPGGAGRVLNAANTTENVTPTLAL